MFSDERRDIILELLEKNGRVLAKELADRFELSIDSIRRDLTIMEEKGLLKRTHGGAIPVSPVRSAPLPAEQRYGEATPRQKAIAKMAASFIRENDSVFIGGAGIHYGMLEHLPDCSFTVVTNSVTIADALKAKESVEVYLIGGKVKSSGNITDSLALDFIRQFSLDTCFLTGGGISANGITTATPEAAALSREAARVSRKVVALAPYDKVGQDFFAKVLPAEDIDVMIADDEASLDVIQELEAKGVKVLIARTDGEAL
ncbi:DeoR/GlpR family DNA-binding transcription regulator [Paenibacillus sp. CC-CFT747]|nr:DeoR/GlpR family DNA-binding transcription regulator [Paenibacillus sp. CC-CFT747]